MNLRGYWKNNLCIVVAIAGQATMNLRGYWKRMASCARSTVGQATMNLRGYWKIERKKTGGRLGTSHHYFAWLLKLDRFH